MWESKMVPSPNLSPKLINKSIKEIASNWHLGSGLSIVLMLFIIVNMLLTAIFDKDGEGSFL